MNRIGGKTRWGSGMRRAALAAVVLSLVGCAGTGGYGSDLDPSFSAYDGCPSWSPDGRLIAFYRDPGVFVVAAADVSSASRVAGTRPSDSLLGWLSSDELVIVRQNRLYAVGVSARHARRLSGDLEGAVLALSPDRRHVLVARRGKVVVASISGGKDASIPGLDREGYNIAWSPDGSSLAYVVGGSSRRNPDRLFVVSRNGSDRRALARGWLNDPAWSTDGRRLAYADAWDGSNVIHVRSAAGGPARPVSQGAEGEDTQPIWSPDGRTIVHQSGGSLWAVSPDGSNGRPLTSAGGFGDECPAFSPDGGRIAFDRQLGGIAYGNSALIVMDDNGSNKRQVH